jgi:hypothetical protein
MMSADPSSSSAAPAEPSAATRTRKEEIEIRRSRALHRTAALSHDTREKKSSIQLRLHLTRARRELDALRSRLTAWDPVEEARAEAEEAKRQLELEAETGGGAPPPKKEKGRKGPETWKLRGAARPAHEVYDFDVRYVDPHREAHDRARERSARTVNALALCRGRASSIVLGRPAGAAAADRGADRDADGDLRFVTPRLASLLRQYLSLLMQVGHLSLESKQHRSAREAWLECVDLEGTPAGEGEAVGVTTARESLLRMCVESGRYESAWTFLATRIPDDATAFVAYTRALVAVRLGKPDADVEKLMVEAVRSNLYCACYLAFLDTFRGAMEYTDEICEGDEMPQTDLEVAIEYCTDSTLIESWESSGALIVLRRLLLNALAGRRSALSPVDVDWKGRLERLQKELPAAVPGDGTSGPAETSGASELDVLMYARMFETAMEMLQESGQLS